MTDKYQDSIYNFFKQKENFLTMVKVASHEDNVIRRIVKEFWEEVKDELRIRLKSESKEDWVVHFSGNFEYRYCKLWMFKKDWPKREGSEWPLFSVAFEDLHFGERLFIGMTFDHNNTLGVNSGQIDELLKKSNLDGYTVRNHDYWLIWKYLAFNFKDKEDLADILIDEKDGVNESKNAKVSELADEAVKLVKVLDEIAAEILNQ